MNREEIQPILDHIQKRLDALERDSEVGGAVSRLSALEPCLEKFEYRSVTSQSFYDFILQVHELICRDWGESGPVSIEIDEEGSFLYSARLRRIRG